MNQIDFDLKHRARKAIMDSSKVGSNNIDVLDKNGVITLKGSVPSHKARKTAEIIVEKMDGVVSVINMLEIQSESQSVYKINIFGMMKK